MQSSMLWPHLLECRYDNNIIIKNYKLGRLALHTSLHGTPTLRRFDQSYMYLHRAIGSKLLDNSEHYCDQCEKF